MRLIKNFYYDSILEYKFNIMKLIVDQNDSIKYTMSTRDLLSLYLIDYENANCEIYDKKMYKDIINLYDKYVNDNNSSIELTIKDIKNIIKVGQNNRIDLDLNKEIANIFLDLYLKSNSNPYLKITQEQFDEICDNLLVE